MVMRRRRPLMRAAMVGGTAYYAGKRAQEGQNREAEQEYRLEELEAREAAVAAAPPPARSSGGVTSETLAQLEQLAELKDKGVLNQEEFEVQKRRLLGTS